MKRYTACVFVGVCVFLCLPACVLLCLPACGDSEPINDDAFDPDELGDDDAGGGLSSVDPAGLTQHDPKLQDLYDELDFYDYLEFEPVRVGKGAAGYTNYYYDKEDFRCYNGRQAHVAVRPGKENKVMFFMEGGGASWPGGGFAVQINYPFDISYRSRVPQNPLRDWTFVYVPYCDNSIHSGDNVMKVKGRTRYFQGLRHTAAAVALTKKLFPDAEKVLVTGASAGGMGTYLAWVITKSQYPDTDTYVLSDSGMGFWNPNDLETWNVINDAWALRMPSACARCDSTVQTWLFDLYLDLDPQVRIGMFTAYQDVIMSNFFLKMSGPDYEKAVMAITNQIKAAHPRRFGRFFIEGRTHTSYEFILPPGPRVEVEDTSLFEWIGQLVNDDPAWVDRLE
ncbi:MAG: pectin acetylesterase-family hydrolase [Candidatus Lernaella stagnicola]|nr:pectin acetylesterase-family hydrolase [Candidatus Lernaella stagnicola]